MAFLGFKEILALIDKVADRGIGALEVESAGVRLRIEARPAPRTEPVANPRETEAPAAVIAASPPMPAVVEPVSAPAAAEPPAVDPSWHVVTSPIVGTFYQAASPNSEPFVRVGDHVTKGAVLCIIEAMKLMNEIESDADGEIAKIFPANGQPIEYGEPLFAIR